jgi:manganese/zinc/iron transport system ATP- binding protein
MKAPRFPYGGRDAQPLVSGADALDVSDLVVAYPETAGPALDQLNLKVAAGSRVALVGPNGAGKSTLLKVVAGLLEFEGVIRVYGLPIHSYRHRVAYLPQRGEIEWRFPMSVRELVLTGRYVHLGWLSRPTRADYGIVDDVLDRLAIAELGDRQIAALSGGQQQRVLLARALAQESDLLLLDEPLTGVDSASSRLISSVLYELQSGGKTIMVATHDLNGFEGYFDLIVRLQDGRQVGSPVWRRADELARANAGRVTHARDH